MTTFSVCSLTRQHMFIVREFWAPVHWDCLPWLVSGLWQHLSHSGLCHMMQWYKCAYSGDAATHPYPPYTILVASTQEGVQLELVLWLSWADRGHTLCALVPLPVCEQLHAHLLTVRWVFKIMPDTCEGSDCRMTRSCLLASTPSELSRISDELEVKCEMGAVVCYLISKLCRFLVQLIEESSLGC